MKNKIISLLSSNDESFIEMGFYLMDSQGIEIDAELSIMLMNGGNDFCWLLGETFFKFHKLDKILEVDPITNHYRVLNRFYMHHPIFIKNLRIVGYHIIVEYFNTVICENRERIDSILSDYQILKSIL